MTKGSLTDRIANTLLKGASTAALVAVLSVPAYRELNKPVAHEQPKPSLETRAEAYNFRQGSDEVLLAKMLWGEARNCALEEKVAIAYTAVNRANDGRKWNGETLKDAILAKNQYSCFNQNDPNYKKLQNPEAYEPKAFSECLDVARKVLSGEYKDSMKATHYHTINVSPKWSKSDKMVKLGKIKTSAGESKHIFYREK